MRASDDSKDTLLQSPKLLLVDDEPAIRGSYATALRNCGYRVTEAGNGKEALEMMAREHYDLVVLDMDMPEMSGWETLRSLREQRSRLPVLVLTAHNELDERVRGLGAGADDYLGKPCHYRELVARVGALLRRVESAAAGRAVLYFGDVVVNLGNFSASRSGLPIELTKTEYALLELLARNEGRPVARQEILEAVWGYGSQANTRTLDTHIWRLRSKLGESGAEAKWILNVSGVGYRLVHDRAPASQGAPTKSGPD